MDRRPEYSKELIGENLRKCRQQLNFSVEQVREYLGLGSTQSIYKWEEGRSFPQADNLFALMELYGMELKDLLCGQRQFCEASLREVLSGVAGAALSEMQPPELILEQQLYGEKEHVQGVKRWVLYLGKVSRAAA